MRGKVAKALRKLTYGEYSPRSSIREYVQMRNGVIVAKDRRRMYQDAKTRYKKLNWKER